jgi:tripartite-type tricarboxylate transporter receptor subunit TctC
VLLRYRKYRALGSREPDFALPFASRTLRLFDCIERRSTTEEAVKRLCAALFVLAAAHVIHAVPAAAQAWPAKPVRIVNTFAPGGAADVLARMVAESLTNALGQQFFVETRAGAGGVIGVQSVAHAEPDGYNFVITTMSLLVIGPITNPKIGFDPFKDLINIAFIAGSPIVFVVNPSKGIKTLKDFVDYAKNSTVPLTYSSSGVGSNGQLVAETFAQRAGIRVEHVPYKGAAQGLTDLVGGISISRRRRCRRPPL